jgi:hypothetical protein
MLRQPTEPEADRATDRSCTDSVDLARTVSRWSDRLLAQRLDELVHQERRPSRCAHARVDEDWIRSPPSLDSTSSATPLS